MKHFKLMSIVALILLSLSSLAQRPYTLAEQAKERSRITSNAPIVFVGRPLQAEFYEVSSGMVYTSTIVQVLKVLRGDDLLAPGTVEMIDSFTVQGPELQEAAKRRFPTQFEGMYGYYFSDKSTYPSAQNSAHSTNAIKLKPYGGTSDARVIVEQGRHGMIIGGLYTGWPSELALLDYINGLSNIRKEQQPVNYVTNPALRYVDDRPGKSVEELLLRESQEVEGVESETNTKYYRVGVSQ